MSSDLTRYAWLSVLAAVVTLVLKSVAFHVTDSVGLLSDALESLVNLSAAMLAMAMLRVAARPADADHAFGHEKAEYISAGVEGALILVAAGGIVVSAWPRLWHPVPVEQVGLGLGLSTLASACNGLTAWVLMRAGKRHRSITLEADAHHLLSDVWSSAGVLVGVACVAATGWLILDPLLALAVGLFVAVTGIRLLQRAADGVLDVSLPPERLQEIETLLDSYRERGLEFHALRTRQAGRSCFVEMHVLVPGDWTVLQGHTQLEEIEEKLRQMLPGVRVLTHLEPMEDPASFEDIEPR